MITNIIKNQTGNQKILTVTIGIPAYNEEANIGNLLHKLILQKQHNFILNQITVYTDASTDHTVEIVTDMRRNYQIIKLVRGKKRSGKFYRLNRIFRSCRSNILIVLDADIGVVGNNFLDNLTKVLISDPDSQMVAAHQIPLRPSNFIGKVIYASFFLWDCIRLSIPDYDHVQNFYGAATAYRGSFARTLNIPKQLSDDRLYTYLMVKRTNGFRYCMAAQVVYCPITTLNDLRKIANRSFGSENLLLDKMFMFKTNRAYIIPWIYKVKGIIKSFYYQPFYTPLALILNFALRKPRAKKNRTDSPLWEFTSSSKKSIDI